MHTCIYIYMYIHIHVYIFLKGIMGSRLQGPRLHGCFCEKHAFFFCYDFSFLDLNNIPQMYVVRHFGTIGDGFCWGYQSNRA